MAHLWTTYGQHMGLPMVTQTMTDQMNSKNNAILKPIRFFIQLEMNSTTVAMPQLSTVEANGVKLDYLERVILKKYPQWKSLAFDYHNDDDFMDDLIDTISNFETDLESLRTKIIDGDSYDRKELDLGRIKMLLKILAFSYEYA